MSLINNNKMSVRLLCFILAILRINSLNYQERYIYAGEGDNVCSGKSLDLIRLRINLDGRKTITHTAWGETTCSEGNIYNWQKINPSEQFIDSDDGSMIYFSQKTRVISVFGELQMIIQRSKVVNATFDNVPYHCEIIGDGDIQHFGIDVPGYPPCTHYIKCDQITAQE